MSLWQTLFGFQGRINRSLFWLAALAAVLIDLAIVALVSDWIHSQYLAVGAPHRPGGVFVGAGFGLIIVAVISVWVGLALKVKRAHDINRSGWWLTMGLIPIYGQLLLLYELGFQKGSARPNRFGEPMAYDEGEAAAVARGPITVLTNNEPIQSPFASYPEPTPAPVDAPAADPHAEGMAAFAHFVPPAPVSPAPDEPPPVMADHAEAASIASPAAPHPVMVLAPFVADLAWPEFGAKPQAHAEPEPGPEVQPDPEIQAPAQAVPEPEAQAEPSAGAQPEPAAPAAPTPAPLRPLLFHPAMVWGRRYRADPNWLEFTAYAPKTPAPPPQAAPQIVSPEPALAHSPGPEPEADPERPSPPLILEPAPREPRPIASSDAAWTPAPSHDSFAELGPITPANDTHRG